MKMSELLYRFKNIGLCYHKGASLPWKRKTFWALHDVSFDVHRGEAIGIIGKNGAGKSSLLRIIAGIIEPDRGTFEQTCHSKSSLQSLNAGFNPLLSGRQNIFLSGLMLGIRKDEIKSHVDEIIEMAELGDFISEPVQSYSNGMKSRLGFSIAYFMNPDVLLIDEALSVGDAAFKEKSARLIKEKVRDQRTTAIIVSHSAATLSSLCDRMICIEHGRSLPELSVKESMSLYMNFNLQRGRS
jgi:lipopolysaccharide transport system ATP-binding protein